MRSRTGRSRLTTLVPPSTLSTRSTRPTHRRGSLVTQAGSRRPSREDGPLTLRLVPAGGRRRVDWSATGATELRRLTVAVVGRMVSLRMGSARGRESGSGTWCRRSGGKGGALRALLVESEGRKRTEKERRMMARGRRTMELRTEERVEMRRTRRQGSSSSSRRANRPPAHLSVLYRASMASLSSFSFALWRSVVYLSCFYIRASSPSQHVQSVSASIHSASSLLIRQAYLRLGHSFLLRLNQRNCVPQGNGETDDEAKSCELAWAVEPRSPPNSSLRARPVLPSSLSLLPSASSPPPSECSNMASRSSSTPLLRALRAPSSAQAVGSTGEFGASSFFWSSGDGGRAQARLRPRLASQSC